MAITCPSDIYRGSSRDILLYVSSINTGTPPYLYELIIDNGIPIRYPSDGSLTTDISHIFQFIFDLQSGIHNILTRVTDNCPTGNLISEEICTINIIDCPQLSMHLDIV